MDSFGSNIQDLFSQEEMFHFVDSPDLSPSELTDSPDCLAELDLLSNSAFSWDEIFGQAENHLSPTATGINEDFGPRQLLDDLTFEDIMDEPSIGSIPPEPESVPGVQQQQPVKEESESGSDSGVFDDLLQSMFGAEEGAEETPQSEDLLA